jgi:hypothetical protein
MKHVVTAISMKWKPGTRCCPQSGVIISTPDTAQSALPISDSVLLLRGTHDQIRSICF